MTALLILKYLLASLGACMFAYVIFAYENEEKKLVSLLESAWIKLSDLEMTVSARVVSMIRVLAQYCADVIDEAYGKLRLTGSAILTAACLLFGSQFLLRLSLLIYGADPLNLERSSNGKWIILFLVATIICYSVPFRKNRFLVIVAIGFASIVRLNNSEAIGQLNDIDATEEKLVVWIAGEISIWSSVFLNFLLLWCIRSLLSHIQRTTKPFSVIFACFGVLGVGLSYLTLGVILAILIKPMDALTPGNVGKLLGTLSASFELWFPLLVLANTAVILTTFLSFFLVATTLLCSVVTFVLPRTAYGAIKLKFLNNRKAVAAASLALMALAYPDAVSLLKTYIIPMLG